MKRAFFYLIFKFFKLIFKKREKIKVLTGCLRRRWAYDVLKCKELIIHHKELCWMLVGVLINLTFPIKYYQEEIFIQISSFTRIDWSSCYQHERPVRPGVLNF